MTDHAGPRRWECHPGTKFLHPPIEITQFWHPRSGFGAYFCKAKQEYMYIDQEAGKKYETKVVKNWFKQCLFYTDEFILLPLLFKGLVVS